MARSEPQRAGRGRYSRRTCLVALGLLLSLGAASALAALVTSRGQSGEVARSLRVGAQPSSQTVAPGASARYVLRVTRTQVGAKGLSGRTAMGVADAGLPAGAGVSFSPQRGLASPRAPNQPTTLTVTTAANTPPGTYTLQVRAHRPRRQGGTAVRLTVSAPTSSQAPPESSPSIPPTSPIPPVRAPDAFTIAGVLPTPLSPGAGVPLDLTLTNRESADLQISSLAVSVASVSAPRADSTHPCGPDDFSVAPFSGAPGFTLPAAGTASLSELGLAPADWPQVSMLNPPVNQDGCKGASLALSFSGTATQGAS